MIKKYPALHETGSSLSCSYESATGFCPEPVESIQHRPTLLRSTLILSSYLHRCHPVGLFLSGLRLKCCELVSVVRAIRLILLDLINLLMYGEEYYNFTIIFLLSVLDPNTPLSIARRVAYSNGGVTSAPRSSIPLLVPRREDTIASLRFGQLMCYEQSMQICPH
jgi:hypothetical protein